MKRLLIPSLVALLGFALSGCASTQTASDGSETRQASQRSDIDYRYVNRVNRQAQRQGTRVEWVNPPRRVQTPSLQFNITTSEPDAERDPK
ncbi:MAG: hypothetical protein ACXIUB_02260 [Wenzhouxiangella sp.]